MANRIDGYVDLSNLAPMVRIQLISSSNEEIEFPAIIDTGYNGEVILPEEKVLALGLEFLGTIDNELADGRVVEIEFFRGRIKWFDSVQEVAIGASQSEDALLGTLLLANCELNVNFRLGSVRVEHIEGD